jgi:putative transcriptional regulator
MRNENKMTKIKHHLTEELMIAYASGNLAESFSVAVATHISLCDQCRAALESYNAIGGALLEDTEGAALSSDALAKTMALIEQHPPEEKLQAAKVSNVPAPLADYIGTNLDAIKWQPIGMGVKQSVLETTGAGSARLLYIPPGTAVPNHSHSGLELTLVLQGAFADETDYFSRGDIEVATSDVSHTPVAADGTSCICLAVTEAPLKFTGLLHKLMQPLLKI